MGHSVYRLTEFLLLIVLIILILTSRLELTFFHHTWYWWWSIPITRYAFDLKMTSSLYMYTDSLEERFTTDFIYFRWNETHTQSCI